MGLRILEVEEPRSRVEGPCWIFPLRLAIGRRLLDLDGRTPSAVGIWGLESTGPVVRPLLAWFGPCGLDIGVPKRFART